MTIICALHDRKEKCTWIGADTKGVNGHLLFRDYEKWIVGKRWAVGIAGYWRGANIVARNLNEWDEEQSAFNVGEVIRLAFKEHDFAPDGEKGEPPGYGHSFLFASASEVWTIDISFGLTKVDGFIAEGSGRELGIGAAYALGETMFDPHLIVRRAVECAIELSRDCNGEPWIHKLGPSDA